MDHAAYRAERVTSGEDEVHVFFLTLARVLRGYEKQLRRSQRGRVRCFHGVNAMYAVKGADVILSPDIIVQEWARRSSHAAHVMNLGMHLTQLASKAKQYGRALLCVCEDFTTQMCSHCGLCEPRGSTLFISCSACGLGTHRDAGNAPNGIFKRALVHGAEAYRGLFEVQGVG